MRAMYRLASIAVAVVLAVTTLNAQSVRTDEQIESEIESQVANSQALNGQAIGIWTHDGIVTLSGQVKDEASRTAAIAVVQKIDGVKSVENHLLLPGEQAPAAQAAQNTTADQPGSVQTPSAAPQYPQPADDRAESYPPLPDSDNPPDAAYPDNRAANQPPPRRYPSRASQRPYGGYHQQTRLQAAVGSVTLPPGTTLNVRVLQGLDTRHTQPGTVFRAVTAQNVFVRGYVAIPRGTTVEGNVVDVQTAGDFKGSPKLRLQLTSLTLDDTNYPLQSNLWSRKGQGKGQETVGNTIGGAAIGAVIGAIAGGGPGAAIGAGIGGVAAAGVTGATPGRNLLVPPEAILTFSLAGPLTVQPVPQDELDRLVAQRQDQRLNAPRPGYPPRRHVYPYGYGYPYPPPPPPYYPYYR